MKQRIRQGRLAPQRFAIMAAAVAWLAVMVGFGVYLSSSQATARRGVTERLAQRAQLGAEFATLYVQSIYTRERTQARRWLASTDTTMEGVRDASSAIGGGASVLLDGTGHVLQVLPAKPALIGQVITGKYAHLAAAVAGRPAVSNVVPSAARSVPVVGFATPFDSSEGRRVFSVAFPVAKTPLGLYMSHLTVIPGRQVYLIDAHDNIIAGTTTNSSSVESLTEAGPALARRARSGDSGPYSAGHVARWFDSASIAGTPWRIIISVPEAALFASLEGADKSLAWVALIGLTLAGLTIVAIGSRLLQSRQRLSAVNQELDRLARLDSLTGLRNRRDIEEQLNSAVSSARRHGSALAVMLIDIDHFKSINDSLGHQAGDAVLISAAEAVRTSLRLEDAVGRWGGEEFLAVLPDTDADGALALAERLRAGVAGLRHHPDLRHPMTVTVGVAAWASGNAEDLITRADAALYAGKASGRNTVTLLVDGAELHVSSSQ